MHVTSSTVVPEILYSVIAFTGMLAADDEHELLSYTAKWGIYYCMVIASAYCRFTDEINLAVRVGNIHCILEHSTTSQ